MFEDSLIESRIGVVSASKRWTMLASIGLQVAAAGVVITLPLLHPEALPFHFEAPKVLMPLIPKPPVPIRVEQMSSTSNSAVSGSLMTSLRPLIPSQSPGGNTASNDLPSLLPFGSGIGGPNALPSGLGGAHGPNVTVVPAKPAGLLHVSTGVSEGMLLVPIRPVYPVIARAAHVEGAVVVEAIISRAGTIESLHVVSGPLMLQAAALDAIREARYRPYRLNGEPTEVQTTITVNFRLGG